MGFPPFFTMNPHRISHPAQPQFCSNGKFDSVERIVYVGKCAAMPQFFFHEPDMYWNCAWNGMA